MSRPQHLCARGFQLPSDACAAPTLLAGSTRARLAAAATPSRSPAPCALGARLHPVVGPALPEYRTRRRLLFCFAATQDLDLGAPPDRRHCLQTQAPQSPLVCAACLSSRSSGSTDSHGRQGKRASERPARTKAGSSHGPANVFFSYAGLGEAQQQQRPEVILQEVPRVGLNPALMAAGASAFVRGPCAPCCAACRRDGTPASAANETQGFRPGDKIRRYRRVQALLRRLNKPALRTIQARGCPLLLLSSSSVADLRP